jgi:4-hydroxy-3-polyprenylbenzoate decarboxylase
VEAFHETHQVFACIFPCCKRSAKFRIGDQVDLFRCPAPQIHEGDGGRYLNTWGSIIVQTLDGSWTNWSLTRIMVTGKNTMTGGVAPGEHVAAA